jgi:hypothetical protein
MATTAVVNNAALTTRTGAAVGTLPRRRWRRCRTSINEDAVTPTIAVTVGDTDTDVNTLPVTATSSDARAEHRVGAQHRRARIARSS